MKFIIKKLKKSEFFVAFSTTGFTSFLQIITGLVINKIIAIKIGPTGIAMLGQFANFRDMITNFGTGAIGHGVTKYIADKNYKDEEIISTSVFFSLFVSGIIGLLLLLFSKSISLMLFRTEEYRFILYILSLTISFFSLNNLLLAIINGKRNFIFLAKVKMANSAVSLIISGLLCWFLSLKGALIAMSINTSIVFGISIIIYFRNGDFFLRVSKKLWSSVIMRKLFGFTLMTLTSVLLKPLVELIIRNFIIEQSSEFDAGLWESIKRIGTYYNQVILVALGAYYLPKLSSLKENNEVRKEVFKGIRRIMPLFVVLALSIYFSRKIIINVLFTKEFSSIDAFFLPQLIGDFFMILSFLVAYLMLAKAMTKLFVITQMILSALRILLSITFFTFYGVYGILWANVIVYFFNCIWVTFIFKNILIPK